jgi:acyl carrier protein
MLAQHPAVRACVVIASKDEQGQNALVAYVVAREHAQVSPGLLHAYLGQHVPAAMIPARFSLLDQLPLTPNGKVDRQALPVPDWAMLAVAENFVPPQTPLEEVVAGIWAEVLRLEQIGVHDNFFTLGGHSLLATQVISQLRDLFYMEIPLRRLFEHPTVAEFVAMLLHDPETRGQVEKTAQLLLSLSQLSEEEVESRLEEQSSVSKKKETP